MIKKNIYEMIIKEYQCFEYGDKLNEKVVLIHDRSSPGNTTTKYIEDIFHTKEDLVEEHVRRLKAHLTS